MPYSPASRLATTPAAPTHVSASASSVTLLAANANRKKVQIANDPSGAILYVSFTSPASSTSYTVAIPAGSLYEDFESVGAIYGIWATASGGACITEWT